MSSDRLSHHGLIRNLGAEEKGVISLNKEERIQHEINFDLEELGTIYLVEPAKHSIKTIFLNDTYTY